MATVVYLDHADVYEFLLDFPRYADYSEHLRSVRQRGEGGPDTEYDLRFQWWKLGYTARTRVTNVDPPTEIAWTVVRDVDAHGYWRVAERDDADRETATEVRLVVHFDPDSVDGGAVDLPPLVSFDWLVDRASDLAVREGERVVERIVADLEGERRPVRLDVTVDGEPYP